MNQITQFITSNIAKIPVPSFIKSSPLYSKFAKGVMWSFIGAVISQGLTLLASVPVARMLGADGYGELGIIQSTLAMFVLFTGTSLGFTATKYVAELEEIDPERTGKLIGLTYDTAIVAGGIFAFLLSIGAPYISKHILNASQLSSDLRIAAVVVFLNSLNGAQMGALAGFQAFRQIAQVNLMRGLVSFPTMIFGVWMWGLTGAIVALAITAGVGIAISQWALLYEIQQRDMRNNYRSGWTEWRILLKFTLPTILSGIVVVPVIWWANVVLVNQTNGYIEMGIFNATNQWRIALVFLPAILTQPTLPMLSKLFSSGSFKEYRSLLTYNLGIVFLSVLVPTIVITIAAPWIMSIYGFERETSAYVLRILSYSAVLSASVSVIGFAISSMGKMWHGLGLNIIWAIIFVGYFISHDQDAQGIANAFFVSYAVHLFTVSIYTSLVLHHKL